MLDIREVLMEENVNLDLNAGTKEEVFTQMTRMLYENGVIREEQPFIDELVHREAEGVTGIGDGIAIPHGRSAVVNRSVIAIGRTRTDVSWETFDDKPVRCIIMFAIRDVDMSQHIMLLSHVAQLLLDKDVIDTLHHARTVEEIVNILRKEESE